MSTEPEYVDDDDFTYQHLTNLTPENLMRAGAALYGWVTASRALGHSHPMDSVMYIAADAQPMSQFVRDVMLNCLFERDEEAAARLDEFLDNTGALDMAAAASWE